MAERSVKDAAAGGGEVRPGDRFRRLAWDRADHEGLGGIGEWTYLIKRAFVDELRDINAGQDRMRRRVGGGRQFHDGADFVVVGVVAAQNVRVERRPDVVSGGRRDAWA